MRSVRWWLLGWALVLGAGQVLGQANLQTGLVTNEYYLRCSILSRTELHNLTRLISIDRVADLTVYAYANAEELARLREAGYVYELLPHPSTRREPRMAETRQAMANWDSYPTWLTYVSMMQEFAHTYPAVCRLDTLGLSVRGKPLLVVKISDNVDSLESEPALFLTSTMHGNELVGYVLLLRLIDYLLTAYAADTRIQNLIDNTVIWINPLANPDGTYRYSTNSVYGATRYNANNVDLNRNFPDPAEGENPDGYAYQPETQAMMAFASREPLVLSANFHGGAEVINYPWDTWQRLHPDDEWFQKICADYVLCLRQKAPANYFTDVDRRGYTNGYAWYRVVGGRQDYMLFFHGCREVTIELSEEYIPMESRLPLFWEYHREALLGFMEQVLTGLHGRVTDRLGHPLRAEIAFPFHDTYADRSSIFSHRLTGMYYRLCLPGIYTIRVAVPPFSPLVTSNYSVAQNTNLDLVFKDFAIGDLDNSGALDLSDVVHVLKAARRGDALDSVSTRLADWNGDTRVDQHDWKELIRYLLRVGGK